MTYIFLLLPLRIRLVINRLSTLHQESRLKIVAVTILGSIFWLGLFALFHWGFAWLRQFMGLETYFTSAMLSLFFFSLLLMLSFSNGIISYSSLFRSSESAFLISCPLTYEVIFLHKFVESLIFSSWAFLLLAVPLVATYGWAAGAGLGFYLVSIPFFGFFILIPAALGALGALLISVVIPSNIQRTLLATLAVLGVLLLWLGIRILATTGGVAPYSYEWMNSILGKINFCQSPFIPSFWVTEGLMRSARGEWGEALFQLGLVASNGLMCTLFSQRVAQFLYPRGWSKIHSGQQKLRYSARGWISLNGRGKVLGLLIEKDFTIFRRDPVQWSQCAILFGLLAIYILNLRAFAFDNEKIIWRHWTSFLNLTATCLVLATLTTRFIFPLLSLEGKRFWILGLLPIRRETLLYGKFLYSLGISLAVSETLILLSDLMLKTSPSILLLHALTIAFICAALSGLSVGMGALYPNLKEDNPSKIVSGFGGTLNLILSLLYVSVVISTEAVLSHLYFADQIEGGDLKFWTGLALVFLFGLTAVTTLVPLWMGSRALARLEV